MEAIETLRWAKNLIQKETQGKQYLIAGWDGMPTVHVDRSCMVGLHFSLLKNRSTGLFDCRVKGYIRACGGYNKSSDMQKLVAECESMANLVGKLEKADIHVDEDTVWLFCEELKAETEL